MATLIDKIEMLIKREKTTPERKKDDAKKSSSEILSELFSAFNADPPKIDEIPHKKSKKSKKKHKKEKKKRSRSVSSSSDSDKSEYAHRRKKRKKAKSKKRKEERSPSHGRSGTPEIIIPKAELLKTKAKIKREAVNFKQEPKIQEEVKVKKEPVPKVSVKTENTSDVNSLNNIDASMIPMPESPKELKLDSNDLRLQIDKKQDSISESDKAKGKIQIKNLKFSAVFEETVKKAEEEARKKAELDEEGECTDTSSSSDKDEESNSHFPKSSDPGGILKQQAAEEIKVYVPTKNLFNCRDC